MLKLTKWKTGFLASSALAVLATSACGDGPTCPSELVVVLQGPVDGSTVSGADDLDSAAAGTQMNISLRSNFEKGDDFVLTVTDENSAVSQFEAEANADGDVTFENITLPGGTVTLEATGSSKCGTGSDVAEVIVLTEADCSLTIAEGPIENSFYAPIPVLSTVNDSDAALPNFQASIEVQTNAGFVVEVFVLDTEAGIEASLGSVDSNTSGIANYNVTLAQGKQAIRATCSNSSVHEASATNTVHVDTVTPSCALTSPEPGVTVTPDHDEQGGTDDGIQMTWSGAVDDGSEDDTEGESVAFFRDALEFPGTAVSATGTSQTEGLAEFTAPGTVAVSFETQDHAGNSCTASEDVTVIYDGCSIAFLQPSATVAADSDGVDANGMQGNFVLNIGIDCAGETAYIDCGLGETSATVPADGQTTVDNVTFSLDPTSEGQTNCTARVVNNANFETSDTQPFTWDTQAPGSVLNITSPVGLRCGDSVVLSVANDLDSNLGNGFQIEVQPLVSGEDTIDITVTNSTGTSTLADVAEAPQAITLEAGSNDIQVVATDVSGNIGSSMICSITVADIILTVDDPAGSGILSSVDGVVNAANELELTVCGTVSTDSVVVSLTVGATLYPTTITTGAWCTNSVVALIEGNHVLNVDAGSTLDARVGSLSIPVSVDLTPPAMPTGLTASAPTHREISAAWDSVTAADAYVVRYNTTPFTNFANEGVELTGVGSNLSVGITQLLAGQDYYIGVAAVDANGNVSSPMTVGPVTPGYDQSGAIGPAIGLADGDKKLFGAQIVGGDFDNDTYSDIAVSAPLQTTAAGDGSGVVYIYFGSETGIGAVPEVTIEGTDSDGRLGTGMTRISWNTLGQDDLAIGAWKADRVYLYDNASIAAARLSGSAPSPNLTLSPGAGSWFEAFGGVISTFGIHLAAGQLDANNTAEDLIIGIPYAGPSGYGGAAIVYGGTATSTSVVLSEQPGGVTGMAGLVGHYFEHPGQGGLSTMGQFVHFLGDTRIGGGVGDFGVSSLGQAGGEDHRIFVMRGRAAPAANSPMLPMVFDGAGSGDLEIVLPGSSGTATGFGESIASIAGTGGSGLRDVIISSALEDTETGHLYIVDGGLTGTHTLVDSTDYLVRISGDTAGARFGGAVANNAVMGGDIDGDGIEDLVVAAGRSALLGVYVWYGASLPVGDISANNRDYFVRRPTGFENSFDSGSKLPLIASWVGDVNGDGLDDICWGDSKYLHEGDPDDVNDMQTDDEGRIEILSDDGI